jgi:hypothetical protein
MMRTSGSAARDGRQVQGFRIIKKPSLELLMVSRTIHSVRAIVKHNRGLCLTLLLMQWAAASEPIETVVRTVSGKQLVGQIASFDDDALQIQSGESHTIAWDDVDQWTYRPVGTVLLWQGQNGFDYAQPGIGVGPNGIQDISLRLENLPKNAKLKSVDATVEFPGGRQVWSSTRHDDGQWKLVLQPKPTGHCLNVALFIEPPTLDVYDRTFILRVTMDDDTEQEWKVTAATHTRNALKVGKSAEGDDEDDKAATVWLTTRDGARLRGRILGIDEDSVRLQWMEDIQLPLVSVRSIRTDLLRDQADLRKFDELCKEPAGDDQFFVRNKDGKPVVISGRLIGMKNGQLQVHFQGQMRKLALRRLLGVALAEHGRNSTPPRISLRVSMIDGQTIVGTEPKLRAGHLGIVTPWEKRVELDPLRIDRVVVHNDHVTFLSDLEPVHVEETPFFRRLWPYRRDESLTGKPLKIGDHDYANGLAVHSRCVLTYALDGTYDSFQSTVGFDGSVPARGRVLCRVAVDDHTVFENTDLRADGEPDWVDVSVKNAQTLQLEIDFGPEDDIGDRVIWAGPRLYRSQ